MTIMRMFAVIVSMVVTVSMMSMAECGQSHNID
jgi:hypothetical protein